MSIYLGTCQTEEQKERITPPSSSPNTDQDSPLRRQEQALEFIFLKEYNLTPEECEQIPQQIKQKMLQSEKVKSMAQEFESTAAQSLTSFSPGSQDTSRG